MLCNKIKQTCPYDVLALIYSFVFVPVFRCKKCKRTFGKSIQYCYHTTFVTTTHTCLSKQYPVLFLCNHVLSMVDESSRASFHDEGTGISLTRSILVLGSHSFCGHCLSSNICSTMIEPNLQHAFFQNMQVVLLQDAPLSHLFHVFCFDWSRDVQILKSELDVQRLFQRNNTGDFRGYMYYKVILPIEHVRCVMNPIFGFQQEMFHFYKNESCLFSDVFINFRWTVEGEPFTSWVEASFLDALLSNDYNLTYSTLISSLYLYSTLVKYWMIQQLVYEGELIEQWPPLEFVTRATGDLFHMPTQTTYIFHPFYLSCPTEIPLSPFIQLLNSSHPTDATNSPYRHNNMASTMTRLLSMDRWDPDSSTSDSDMSD